MGTYTVNTPVSLYLKSGEQSMNGTVYGTTTIGSTAESGQTIYLFALHTEYANYIQYAKCRGHRYKIYDGTTLVRDFIPVYTDMKIGNYTVLSNGMWDAVNQQFYANNGSGNFTYGVDA